MCVWNVRPVACEEGWGWGMGDVDDLSLVLDGFCVFVVGFLGIDGY